jgi:predicted DNA-binding ArsR family transcriptional regulator
MNGRPKTVEEYVRLVEQALDELEDILEAASFDFDEVESNLGFVEALKKELTEMRASMRDGSYQFGRNDLPLMRIVKKHTDRDLPCIRLFYTINQTHRQGLDVSGS